MAVSRSRANDGAGASLGPANVAAQYRSIQGITTDHLRSAILSGDVPPGTRLSQDELASRLHVSRMPVREALHVLASEGLVELRTHRSAVVVSLEDSDIAEIFGIRALVEARAVELAVPKHDKSSLADLRSHRTAMAEAVRRKDPDRWLALNREFHRLAYTHCPWPRLQALIEAQLNALSPYFRLWGSAAATQTLTDHMPRFDQDHEGILRALEAGDAKRASRLTEEHILHASEGLRAFLASRRAPSAGAPKTPVRVTRVRSG